MFGNYFTKVMGQIGEFLKTLSPMKKAAMAGTTGLIIAGIAAMFIWAGNNTYQTLTTNLTPEDSANIIRVLREKKIPFTLDQSGKNISVPPESVDILRLELAMTGMPQSSTIGYEVFDKQSLG